MTTVPAPTRRYLLPLLIVATACPLLAAGTAAPATAGPGSSAEVQVNTTVHDQQVRPAIAIDADGDHVVTWVSLGQDGSDYGIYAQRYNSTGTPQGTETLVNTTTADAQDNPSVATDADGDYVITWASRAQDGGGSGIYAQRYNSTGTPQGTETLVNTATVFNQTDPEIAMDGDGDYVITWTSMSQDGSGRGIYAQRYNSTGTPQGSETLVNTTTASNQTEPNVAMDADGDHVITWTSTHAPSGGVYAQRYDATGTPEGAEIDVTAAAGSFQHSPSVALDAAGNFVITWSSYDQDGSEHGVYAQRYDLDGLPQGAETRVNTTTAFSQHGPNVALDADGDRVVAWTSYGQDGSEYGVFARRFRGPQPVDLALAQSDNADTVAARGKLVYRVRISNRNEASLATGIEAIDAATGAASGVRVFSTIPDGATYLSSSGAGWTCSPTDTTVRCSLTPAIAAGEVSPGLLLNYSAPGAAGPALHHARVDGSQVDPAAADNVEVERTNVLCSVQFTNRNYAGTEEDTTVTATVTRTGTGCGPSSVAYATTDGSATAGADYTESSGTLEWTDAQTSISIAIPITNDSLDEELNERFAIRLSDPNGVLLGARGLASAVVRDDDDPPRLNFTTTTATAAEPGPLLDVTVQLSEISGRQVTVALAKFGTASFLSDYYAPHRLTLPAGERSATFTVEVVDDTTVEGTETATIGLSAATAATIGTRRNYRLTITDDD